MLAQVVESYLMVQHACGFGFKCQGSSLRSFASYSDARGKHHVCSEIAIEWAGLACLISQRARRLGQVIRFARYARAEDPSHELPPAVFGKENRRRPTPYIFSPKNVQRLGQAASTSGYPTLRRKTYSTLFSLLACTGLRVSEAIRLRFEDVTPDGLVVRRTKFRKSRLVPLHGTARAGLERYLEYRRPYAPFDDHLFVSLRRKPLLLEDVGAAFRTAVEKIGIKPVPGQPRPTPHSLRHTFAVRALKICPDDRDHITRHMLALSTYLGHSNVSATYWLKWTPLSRQKMHKVKRVFQGLVVMAVLVEGTRRARVEGARRATGTLARRRASRGGSHRVRLFPK
ncbi:MAG: tyrosine-type recombinase/integrase [Gammaproteobacteria bacterium]|nr:tyrosine-type recombinase/integrase [Gammaproteobacteria bacterium]